MRIYKGAPDNIHAEFFRVVGFGKGRIPSAQVITIQEGKNLNDLLGEARRQGVSWTREERLLVNEIFIPWREQINANAN